MRSHWRLAVVLLVQAGILAAMAGRHAAVRAWGTAVTLKTMPVDPYDLMSGYYLVLRYEVEQPLARLLPEGLRRGDRLWLVVRRAEPAWELAAVERERPQPAADRVALPARWDGSRATIDGADRVYVPEAQRAWAERLQRENQSRGLADLRVGSGGTVAVVRLRIGNASLGD